MIESDIPTSSLKDSIHNLEVLHSCTTGESCPRCSGKEFGSLGTYKYKGKKHPRKLCRTCGYVISIVDPKEGFTRNRAARILNLADTKANNLIDDAIQFGIIKRDFDGTYSKVKLKSISKSEMYYNIPLYKYLIEIVGCNLQRRVFETALKSHPDKTIASASKIKRDTLWRRYQEIATEIFVCEKTCRFCLTCTKEFPDRYKCDIVKRSREKKPS